VAPEGPLGDRLLEIVEPLRRAREADQGGAPVVVYRAPPGLDAAEAWKWKEHVYRDESVAEEDQPRYLLVLGDVDNVSLEQQQVLASDLLVGRLVCPTEDGYAAYVNKVLRWEKAPSAEEATALFFTARDGTSATSIGHRALVTPSLDQCRERQQKGKFHARDIQEIPYDGPQDAKDAFLAQVARPDPSMLFSMSHGLGAPRAGWGSPDEQRASQGAMSVGGGVRITAEEVGSVPFLPGGIWFFLACYGGGTPAVSAYYHWLSRLRDAGGFGGRVEGVLAGLPKPGDRPFIAALPQAVLANPNGPLALIAHMDLAWTYSFQDMGPNGQNRPSRFQGIFRSLVDGARAGTSYNQLLRFMGETSHQLTDHYNEEARRETLGQPLPNDPSAAAGKANLWMLRQDLGGYVLLGDPATRLPIARGARATPAAPRTPSVTTTPIEIKAAPPPAPADFAAAAAPSQGRPERDPFEMEEAVEAWIKGEDKKAITDKYRISRATLKEWVDAYQAAGRAALAVLP
jgi:hypothetical protein